MLTLKLKKMKSIIYTLLFVSTIAFSQQIEINNLRDVFTLKNNLNPYSANSNIKGTPFIHAEFQNITIQGNEMKGKYNANQDYIELDKEGKTVFFLPAIEYRYEVMFTDLNVSYRAFKYEDLKYTFYKILSKKGEVYLLAKEFINLKPEVIAKSNYDVSKPARFQREKDVYFIQFSGKDLVVELPTRKSKFLKVFGENSNVIKNFMKKEKLNIKKEIDLIKIFDYFTTL